jgi:hypothetical protein
MDNERVANHTHPAGHRYVSMVDFLRHLVDDHGIMETVELWGSEALHLVTVHRTEHGVE